jgi:hypothetical protein
MLAQATVRGFGTSQGEASAKAPEQVPYQVTFTLIFLPILNVWL